LTRTVRVADNALAFPIWNVPLVPISQRLSRGSGDQYIQTMKFFPTAVICALCVITFCTAAFAQTGQAPVCASLTAANLTYNQNFDTLATSGTTNTSVPVGFGFSETGVNANIYYRGNTGSSTSDTYSFGSNPITDRAFGTQRTAGTISTIGGCFVNNTGAPITSFTIKYDGEFWFLGTTGRVDGLDFQYSTNATSLTDGTWTDVNALDFVTPVPNDSTGQKDGNNPAYRTAGITATVAALNVADGAKFYIRFLDRSISGNNDGLGIDDFSLTAAGSQPGTFGFASSTVSVSESYSSLDLTVNRTNGTNGAVTVGYSFTNGTATGGAVCGSGIDFGNSGSSVTFADGESVKTISVPICPETAYEPDETFSVTLTSASAGGVIGSPDTSTVTVSNDDLPAIMQFGAASFKGAEASNAAVTVERTGDTSSTTTVYFTTSNGTANAGTCGDAGVDFEATAGTIVFSPGDTSKDVYVTMCGDLNPENPAESFSITLSDPTVGILGPQTSATVQILDAATQFTNTNPITIATGESASPYPSTISVSGYGIPIGGLRLSLFGVTAPQPENLRFLLVSPVGQGYLFMGGVGGSTTLQNATITLEDEALIPMPASSSITEGQNYKPTNCAAISAFPDPAPAVPYWDSGCTTIITTFASTFGGLPPDGNWTLYVRDAGTTALLPTTISGWGMEFNTLTAARTRLLGRVMNSKGRAIKNATVTVSGGDLTRPKSVITKGSGKYSLDGLTAGRMYFVTVEAKGYHFSQSGTLIKLQDTTELDFIAEP